MKDDLLVLDEFLQDPFQLETQLESFASLPEVQKIIKMGKAGADSLLHFLSDPENPGLARTAMLTLAQLDPELFYPELLTFLENASQEQVEPLDAGIWRIKIPEDQIAKDLMEVVLVHKTPYPILLIQRPAAKAVEVELQELVESRESPYDRYATYCLGYF